MTHPVTIPTLQQMKRERRQIVAVVVYDYQMAQLADRAGVDIVSVGDSVGINVWGHRSELDVTLDEMILSCRAVRRGVTRALVSCDLPFGPVQAGIEHGVSAAIRLVKEGGADLVKVDGASAFPEVVSAITRAGIPVWAQFGITPHTALRYGGMSSAAPDLATEKKEALVAEATILESAGAVLLDFTNSGSVAGPAASAAVSIPVLGGLGGGPWLDGRVRALYPALGYLATSVDDEAPRYANVAKDTLDAIVTLADDIRAGRQLRGARG